MNNLIRKNICIFALLISMLPSCNISSSNKSYNQGLKDQQDITKNGLNISSDLLQDIQAKIGKEILPFKREVWKYDKNNIEENYTIDKGIYFDFIDETTAHTVFKSYKEKIKSSGNYIFLTELDFDDSFNSYYDIVILNEVDQFELVKLIGTHGINYDQYNDDVVKQLRDWHQQVEFELVVIDVARIHAYMQKKPVNVQKFAEEVYKFCPDVIDQGYASIEEMISDYRENKYFWLWWD